MPQQQHTHDQIHTNKEIIAQWLAAFLISLARKPAAARHDLAGKQPQQPDCDQNQAQ